MINPQDTPGVALLFPGQGSQAVGMGRALYDTYPAARAVFEEAGQALGFSLSEIIFRGPEETLRLTEHTQPAILTVSVAAWRVLEPELAARKLPVRFAAGHSLGEFSAYVAAGALTFADAVRTVRARGQFMQTAVPAGEGAMAAILGLNLAEIETACQSVTAQLLSAAGNDNQIVTIANLNSPDQTVISGSREAVEQAAEACKQRGAKRAVLLPVSAPFHCPLMMPAQLRLAAWLGQIPLSAPRFPVICNVDALPLTQPEAIRGALIRQVTGAVRWVECMGVLQQNDVTHLIEVGPGKVLTGLNRQIDRSLSTSNVEDPASLGKTLERLTAPA